LAQTKVITLKTRPEVAPFVSGVCYTELEATTLLGVGVGDFLLLPGLAGRKEVQVNLEEKERKIRK